jgi:hypothetical protein
MDTPARAPELPLEAPGAPQSAPTDAKAQSAARSRLLMAEARMERLRELVKQHRELNAEARAAGLPWHESPRPMPLGERFRIAEAELRAARAALASQRDGG